MENIQETLKRILQQPQLSEEDQQWLLRYLESADQSELKQLLQQHFNRNLETDINIESDISNRLLQGIHDKLTIDPVRKRSVVKMVVVRVAAAAAVMVLVFGAFYFLSKKEPQKTASVNSPAPAVQPVAEVAPGTDGAILTLADGRKILLDSLHDGALNEDKGSKIVKQGNQVVYKDLQGQDEIAWNTMSTPRGRQFQLVLSDGTKVWLNAGSSIRFPTVFTGNDRRVEISGELYFEVAPSVIAGAAKQTAKRPFIVKVNGTEIEVLGTHFNVNGYDELVKTTLLEGSVKVKAGNNTGILKPGQQSQSSSEEIKTSNSVNIEEVMAWKNGRFVFEDASLETIMTQVSRWYDVDVIYQDKIPKRSFTADISRKINLSVFLKVLDESGVRFTIEGKKLLVKP